MKTLYLTLLASIILCFGVFQIGNKQNIKHLTMEMQRTNTNLKTIKQYYYDAINRVVFYSPEYEEDKQRLIKANDFLKNKEFQLAVSTNPKMAKETAKKWNQLYDSYFDIVIEMNDEIKSELQEKNIINENFYHDDKNFQKLLIEIQKQNSQYIKFLAIDYIAQQMHLPCFTFSNMEINGFNNLKVQRNKTIKFPFFLDYSKYQRNATMIRKMWVNNELVFEKSFEKPFWKSSYKLPYKGKKGNTIKVETQQFHNSPIVYKEYTYDFEDYECQ